MTTQGIIVTSQLVSSLIGKDLITKAISESSGSIYNLLYGIIDYRDLSIESLINELDIENKINIVELLVNQIKCNNVSKLILTSLSGLHEIILNIRENLNQISKIIDLHKQKYFNYWRSLEITKQTRDLYSNVKILNSRLDMFMKILSIPSNLQKIKLV